ncbi:ankyrin repeat-containing protein BDA1-like [Mangifera indica]|uniref:ankyrin repeat-containing protein BDA1-like n=1 Tax=Mangifera indica TaxID=29780 RepID=UPI001CFBADC6|nr:ankyrin repeat-containing protein BDA1-like [Mangifera indica]
MIGCSGYKILAWKEMWMHYIQYLQRILMFWRILIRSHLLQVPHTAASQGKIHFAKEILNLKPSFAWKRDHLGRSPLHLALLGKHLQKRLSPCDLDLERKYQALVTWLIKHDSELVRVKARGMVTPLHYAAQLDDESNMTDFLYVCPSSIEDLTVRSETAVHVALKNGSLKAFKVLLGWLRYFNKEEILNWEDEEGNDALHTAVSANQAEAVKLLIGCMKVNKKNSKGLTALDIFYDGQGQGLADAAVRDILLAAKAKTASQLHRPSLGGSEETSPFENSFGPLSFSGNFSKTFGLGYLKLYKVPPEVRNVLLVVAILIATTTYQAAISPPGGYWQDNGNPERATTTTAINNTTTDNFNRKPFEIKHFAGNMIFPPTHFFQFLFFIFNSLAFFMSLCLISILVTGLPFCRIIITMTSLMVLPYFISIGETSEFDGGVFIALFSITFQLVIIFPAYFIPTILNRRHLKLTLYGRRRNLRLGSFEQPKK